MSDDILAIQILDQIIAELNTNRPTDVPEVTARRTFPDEIVREPRMAVFLGDEQLDPPRAGSNADPLARRRLAVAVQCVGVTDNVGEIDRTVQPMLAWATQVLGRSRLGGLVHYVRERGTERRPTYLEIYRLTATQIYEVAYQTLRDDQTRRV